MKTLSHWLTVVIMILAVLLLVDVKFPAVVVSAGTANPAALPNRASATPQGACDASRSVQVSGAAVVNVAPDRASIQLGVQTNGSTPTAVEDENTRATQAVIQAIRRLGVDAKDIATDLYVIEPVYDDYSALHIQGYRINNIIAITLRDVSKTSPVISAALQAGANQVVNVEFFTSELRKYRDQARAMAVKAASEKAQALAESAGAETNCILTISENSSSYYNGWWYGRTPNQNQWTQNAVQNVDPGSAARTPSGDEPVSLGMISVRAEISATFGLK